jgi:hypothetical protein
MGKEGIILVVLSIILLISLALMLKTSMTGFVTESSTTSNVTIVKFLSIDFSGNMSSGIMYGSVGSLPAVDINASGNYNGASSASTYFINVSTDSNVAVDFCIKANSHLSTGQYIIGLGNETYQNSSMSNLTSPGPSTSSSMLTTSYSKASDRTGQGNVTYYRFWLDVPSGVASGDYNNTVSFKGVETTTPC